MTTDTMAPSATTIDIPALIKGLLTRSDNPPDIEVDVEQLAQMLTTDDGKDDAYRMMLAEYRDRQDAARALSTQAADILSLKAQVATLTEAAEDDAEFASDIVKAICDHVGLDPDPEGYTSDALQSLLEERNAATDQDRDARNTQVALAKELAVEMVRAHDLLTTFVREHSDPGTNAMSSLWCMDRLISKARSAGLLPADIRATPTQARDGSMTVVFTAPAALHVNTVTLVADFASALATKLRASEIKRGWTAGWMRKGWREGLVSDLVRHIHKGDPVDVAAYCAFAWFHGWSVAPAPHASLQVPEGWIGFPKDPTDEMAEAIAFTANVCGGIAYDVWVKLMEAAPPLPSWQATHRHRKGGLYRVIARAELEADLSPVVVYESPEGRVWVRPAAEFDDGRFTVLPAPPAQEVGQ